MEKEDEQKVRAVVEEILANADMDETTEKQVRKLAADKTGLDLSIPEGKRLVLSIIKKFLSETAVEDEAPARTLLKKDERVAGEDSTKEKGSESEDQPAKVPPRKRSKQAEGCVSEDDQPAEPPPPKKRAKQAKRREAEEENEEDNDKDFVVEDEDEDEDDHRKGKKQSKYKKDEQGNIIVCELSAKRKVVVSQWKGRTLVSLREYYEKDGKTLPTSKGISLTAEQFQLLAKKTDDIEEAIATMQ